MSSENTNWNQSVAGVVIRNNNVLLGRHTYGSGNGKLIIPGGYVDFGETPQAALKREFMEETNVKVEPGEILGIRFNMHDWYIVFRAEYVSGEAASDNNENSEVLWVDVDEALTRDDVPELTKKCIQCAISGEKGLHLENYEGSKKQAPYSLYTA
ncbi:MAG: NUDIX hydrolase [Acetatifactor sp.]|nr:NUDIX hydrolase [Acetatifactor sp.]